MSANQITAKTKN